jgi:NifB/MoaA-like Fe-S oxidoreductase
MPANHVYIDVHMANPTVRDLIMLAHQHGQDNISEIEVLSEYDGAIVICWEVK